MSDKKRILTVNWRFNAIRYCAIVMVKNLSQRVVMQWRVSWTNRLTLGFYAFFEVNRLGIGLDKISENVVKSCITELEAQREAFVALWLQMKHRETPCDCDQEFFCLAGDIF